MSEPESDDQRINLSDIGDLLYTGTKETLPDFAGRFAGDVPIADAKANLRTLDTAIYEFSRLPKSEREPMGISDADLTALKGAAGALRTKIVEKTRVSGASQQRRGTTATASPRNKTTESPGKQAATYVEEKFPGFFTGKRH